MFGMDAIYVDCYLCTDYETLFYEPKGDCTLYR